MHGLSGSGAESKMQGAQSNLTVTLTEGWT
jgi:hypothetical protein